MSTGSELFTVKPCARLKSRNENAVIAQQSIPRGTVIHTEKWMERISFVATTEEEAAEFGQEFTFQPEESAALTGGTIVSQHFTHFTSPAHLQMTCTLILKRHAECQKWVREKTFLNHVGTGLGQMNAERHQAAIKWLKEKTLPTVALIFWANREHFTQLYNMVACNAPTLELPLSDTTIGLVFCPTLAWFNHDCVPNAILKKLPWGYYLTALENIQRGDEICYSYLVEAVGLTSQSRIDRLLMSRHGFECKCPTHLDQRPLYRKNVRPPTPLAVVYYKNRLLEAEMRLLERHYRAGEWIKVREVCDMLASGFFPVIREEPRLAFAISYRYAMSVPNCVPAEDGDMWLTLLTYVVTNYCTNPVILARCFFLHILHLVRKFNIIAWNPDTSQQEHVFGGCQGKDLNVFMTNYINLRQTLTMLGPILAQGSDLISLESNLFTGLSAYLSIMEKSVRDLEQRLAELPPKNISRGDSLNYTTCTPLIHLVNSLVTGADLKKVNQAAVKDGDDVLISSRVDMDRLILEANYRTHPDEFDPSDVERVKPKKAKKAKKAKKTKKAKKENRPKSVTSVEKSAVKKKKVAKMLAELNNTVMCSGAYWIMQHDTPVFIPSQLEISE